MKSALIQQFARFSKFYFSGGSRMVYRPLRSIGRFGLAACAVSLGVASLSAQSAPSTTAPVGPNPSRVDVFLGYSYFGAHGEVKPGYISYSSVNLGAIGSGAYYFNKYVGGEVVAVSHPDGVNDGLFTASAGLIVRAPMQNFTVFAHGLAGGAYLGGPNSENPATFEHEPYTWGPALTAGGGMDYDLPFFDNKFSLRLFQADYRYIHADFGPYTQIPTGQALGGRANLSGVDLSTGIVAHFGHIIPPPPVTYACSVSPASGYPGDPFTVTGTASNLNPKKTATYTWTSTGGTISGTSSTANIDTKSAQPGSYTVTGHISEGNKPGEMADCTAPFTVKAFEPPTISCSANPSTVNPGDSATITANGVSPQNRPLTYSYSATSGSINGTSSTATLSTTGAAPGTITVTCNVVDDKGQTASTTTQVTVQAPPPPPAPKSQSLCSISFDRDARRPTRVDNEGKACLDDLALQLQNTTGATLDLVGNASTSEKEASTKAAERAVNTKDYLVKEKGIDASRIAVFTGTDDAKTVTSTLVPSGATPVSATPVDESTVKAQPRQPLHEAKHHHHHKKAASNS
jgi:outer membrane protein OmpA-like peptidoglycan-associated protein